MVQHLARLGFESVYNRWVVGGGGEVLCRGAASPTSPSILPLCLLCAVYGVVVMPPADGILIC